VQLKALKDRFSDILLYFSQKVRFIALFNALVLGIKVKGGNKVNGGSSQCVFVFWL